MIKKITYLCAVCLTVISIVSCEKDFTEVGATIIDNSKFTGKELILDVDISQQNVTAVKSGNTEVGNTGNFLLGIYKKPYAQTLHAGIVSQLVMTSFQKTNSSLEQGESLSDPILDEVVLKLPVSAILKGKLDREVTQAGETKTIKVPDFRVDSLLGNPDVDFTLNVYRNGTYLSILDPNNPAKIKTYYSDFKEHYSKEGSKLNVDATLNFKNINTDTLFIFDRHLSNGQTYKDTLKVQQGSGVNTYAIPFISIRLDKTVLKTILFDKLIRSELNADTFNEYFKGLIIEVEGTDGAVIPLNLGASKASVDFISTQTVLNGTAPVVKEDGTVKTVENTHSFSLGGVQVNTYTMSGTTSAPSSVVLQGTAGSVASIKILEQDTNGNGLTDLEELRKKNIIINEAQLILDINTQVDTTKSPGRLFLYKNKKNTSGELVPSQLGDLLYGDINNLNSIDGTLKFTNEKPDYYSFNIRRHLTDVLKGTIPNSELIVRVLSSTDFPNERDISIKQCNWNPRSVPLLDNTTEDGKRRGIKLKISYTEEK